MKKLYSLEANGREIVSVEMDVPDFMPHSPTIDRKWLKGIITEEVATIAVKPARRPRAHRRLARLAKVHA